MKIVRFFATPWLYVLLLAVYIIQLLSIPVGTTREMLKTQKAGPIHIKRSRIYRYWEESRLPLVGWWIGHDSAVEVHATYKGRTQLLVSESSYEPEEVDYGACETDMFVFLFKVGSHNGTVFPVTAFVKDPRDRAKILKVQVESRAGELRNRIGLE